MILSIPLFSWPLLLAAGLIGLGLLAYPVTARASVVLIGAGSVVMGAVVMTELPQGFELQAAVLFGMAVVVGGWMMFVGVKNG